MTKAEGQEVGPCRETGRDTASQRAVLSLRHYTAPCDTVEGHDHYTAAAPMTRPGVRTWACWMGVLLASRLCT